MEIIPNKLGRIVVDFAAKKTVIVGELITKPTNGEYYRKEIISAVARGDQHDILSDLLSQSNSVDVAKKILTHYYADEHGEEVNIENAGPDDEIIKNAVKQNKKVNAFATLEEAKRGVLPKDIGPQPNPMPETAINMGPPPDTSSTLPKNSTKIPV